MKISATALAIMLAMGSTQALAQQSRLTTAMGYAKTSCGTWAQARTSHESGVMEFWVVGFVSGANAVLSLEGTDAF
jgi:ABC-type uncharacterized transport system YnjBCD permease subunit